MVISRKYDSVLGAKLLLAIAYEKEIALNVTKVQKMLYIIYSYFLAKEDIEIFSESPKAWPYGPVFPRARGKVDYGKVYKLDDKDLEEIKNESTLVNKMKDVVDKYSKYTATQLSNWSHMEGSPWERTTKQDGFKWGDFIPNGYVIDYFSKLTI